MQQRSPLLVLLSTLASACTANEGADGTASDAGFAGVSHSGAAGNAGGASGGAPSGGGGGQTANGAGAASTPDSGSAAGSDEAAPDAGVVTRPIDPCVAANSCAPGTWVNVTDPAIDLFNDACGNYGTKSILVDPLNAAELYSSFNCDGSWKSTDYGSTPSRQLNTSR